MAHVPVHARYSFTTVQPPGSDQQFSSAVFRHQPPPVGRSRRRIDFLTTARCWSPSFAEITSRTVNTAPTCLTRQALRSEAAAREHAERSLADAQVSIRDLQTKLAHESRAQVEVLKAVARLETETQAAAQAQETAEAELVAEDLGRRNAENALAEALDTRQEAEEQLRDAMAVREARMPPQTDRGLADSFTIRRRVPAAQDADAEQIAGVARSSKTQARRRGRPAKVGNQDSEVVEWWKPGWLDKFR